MSALEWLAKNWFTLLNAAGIVGGLLFTAFSLRSETKTRRIANLLTITQNHREMWAELSRRTELHRILEPHPIVPPGTPFTREEEIYVTSVILHLHSVFEAMKNGLFIKPEGLCEDVSRFFSTPIQRAVWEKNKTLQNDDFVEFVDSCLGVD